MRRVLPALLAALLAVSASASAQDAAPTPVLVELYTSQGCSSCPPADEVLADLARTQPVEGALIVPMSLHVDYWNRLGWRDPYSSKTYSARQHGYSDSSGRRYTPQMVVDGAARFIGSSQAKARKAVAEAARSRKAATELEGVVLSDGRVRIGVSIAPLDHAAGEVLVSLAVTEEGLGEQVRRGENAGRRLEHAAVVRSLQTLGGMSAEGFRGDAAVRLEGPASRSTAVVFAQETSGERRVLAVGTLRLDGLAGAR